MARAASVDSVWVGTLASGVSIGGTSSTLSSVVGTNWPDTGEGIFGIQIGEDPDTDGELVQVTRSGATLTNDASTPTFTKAHSAGANVYYLTTAPDINAKADDSAVVHDTGNETGLAGNKTWTGVHEFVGVRTDDIASVDSTASIGLGTDSMILVAGSAFIIVDGSNGFLQVYAVFAASGGFSLGLIELPLTGDYTLAASGAECQRILVDPDANGYTIEMSGQLSAFGEVIFENVSGTYSFDVGDEPITGATVAGGPINIPAGTEKKFYYRNGTNEWRETSL